MRFSQNSTKNLDIILTPGKFQGGNFETNKKGTLDTQGFPVSRRDRI